MHRRNRLLYSDARRGSQENVYQQLQQMNMNAALPIAAGAYDGVTCVGTFTSAHVEPEGFMSWLRDAARRDCLRTVREEYWQDTHFPEVLNQIVESGRADSNNSARSPMSTRKNRPAKWWY